VGIAYWWPAARRGQTLGNLGLGLRRAGQHGEAITAVQDAAVIYQEVPTGSARPAPFARSWQPTTEYAGPEAVRRLLAHMLQRLTVSASSLYKVIRPRLPG
jgi:hypothetical protein